MALRDVLLFSAALLAGCPAVIEVEGDHDFGDLAEALLVTEYGYGDSESTEVLLSSRPGACERRQETIDALADALEVEVPPPEDWGQVQQVQAWCDASVERGEGLAAAYATDQPQRTWTLRLRFARSGSNRVQGGTYPVDSGLPRVSADVLDVLESPWQRYVDTGIDCVAYAEAIVASERVWALPLGPTSEDSAEGLDAYRATAGQVVVEGDEPSSIRADELLLVDSFSRYAGTISFEADLEECRIDDEQNLY